MAGPTPAGPKKQNGRKAKESNPYSKWATGGLGLALLVLLMIAVASLAKWDDLSFTKLKWSLSATGLWVILAVLTVVILWLAGYLANGRWFGVLIDERYRTSLSRLQIGMWTVIAMSAFLAVALTRSAPGALKPPTPTEKAECEAGVPDDQTAELCPSEPAPLRIVFPNALLVALGISTLSFAGSGLVKTNKRAKRALVLISDLEKKKTLTAQEHAEAEAVFKAADTEYKDKFKAFAAANVGATQAQADEQDGGIKALGAVRTAAKMKMATAEKAKESAAEAVESAQGKVGTLKVNDSVADATLADMFQGNEVGNYNLIDLSKVQMFLFTVAIGVAYAAALVGLFQGGVLGPFGVELPEFSQSLNGLLGISHAGYIATQSIDHSQAIE